jgi:hypothetical protein
MKSRMRGTKILYYAARATEKMIWSDRVHLITESTIIFLIVCLQRWENDR